MKIKEPRTIVFPADTSGCSWWRLRMPALENQWDVLSYIPKDKRFYDSVTHCKLQRQLNPKLIPLIKRVEGVYFEYDSDDLLNKELMPDYNHVKDDWSEETEEQAIAVMNACNLVTVSTETLKNYYKDKITTPIHVTENKSAQFWFGGLRDFKRNMQLYGKHKKRPRVLWSGSATHFDVMGKDTPDDFEHVIRNIANLAQKYQFVFVGAYPPALKPLLDRGIIEAYSFIPITDYPRFLSELECSVSIAPLQENFFNECKSNIKFLESAYLGIPCICQDMITYEDAFLKFKTGDDLAEKLKQLYSDRKYYEKQVKRHLEYGNNNYLEG